MTKQSKQGKRRLGVIGAAVFFGVAGVAACGSEDADTATTRVETTSDVADTTTTVAETTTTVAETTTTVAKTTTAVTTGLARWYLDDGPVRYKAAAIFENEPLVVVDNPYPVPVTGWSVSFMVNGESTPTWFDVDDDVLNEIWPDGVTTEGVRVTIEGADGEQRVSGLAD